MRCSKARNLLSSYMDGELTNKERELLESHVKDCINCSRELETLRGLHNTFAAMKSPTAPYGFATRVMAYVEERKAKRQVFLPVFTRALEAAAIIAIIIVGTRTGGFLGSAFMKQKTTIVSSLSLDTFDSVQPNSIGGAYIAMMEGNNEK